jgi:hypothetical protein
MRIDEAPKALQSGMFSSVSPFSADAIIQDAIIKS